MLGAGLMVLLFVSLSLCLYVSVSLSLCPTSLNKIAYTPDCLAATINSKRKKPWDKANAEDEKNIKRLKLGL